MQRGGISKWDIILGNKALKKKRQERDQARVLKSLPIPRPPKEGKSQEDIITRALNKLKPKNKQIQEPTVSKRPKNNGRPRMIKKYNECFGEIQECCYCGAEILSSDSKDYTVEHLVPFAAGGSNTIYNTRPGCCSCNAEKGELTIDEWLNILYREYDNSEGLNSLLLYKIMRVQLIKRYVDRMGTILYK